MAGELDLQRLAGLPDALGLGLEEIVSTLIAELDQAIARAAAAIDAGDLQAAAGAAHAGRNSALMVRAQPLLDALGALEDGAAGGAPDAARSGYEMVRQRWPPLRAALVLMSRRPTAGG